MKDPIEYKVVKWDGDDLTTDANKYSGINRRIIYLNSRLFNDYEPHSGPSLDFYNRLNRWLENAATDFDQKTLFELIPHLFYIGREELNVLYREAYITNYARWLIDILNIDFTNSNISEILNSSVEETWFCPLTDSLRINQFYHVNNIPGGNDYRPDWRSLVKFGDSVKIKRYIEDQKIKRIVLLEDFIGNGGQVSKAVTFAVSNFPDIPILVVPLIICPAGIENSKKLSEAHANITISPVICMNENSFIKSSEDSNEEEIFKKVCSLAIRSYAQVSNSPIVDENIDPYGPFGWRNTGGIIIMHTNTPNNTLPLIHNESDTWVPLFKRHKRV
jgi:hypothetical protein